MAQQLAIYQQLIMAIDRAVTNHKIKLAEPEIPLSFDWNKVKWAFDLWMTEQKFLDNYIEWTLFLDEGIPGDTFNGLEITKIVESCDSKDHVGLQIADMIVVLIGKLVSQMTASTRYDFNKPEQRVLLDNRYFVLNEQQYELTLELNKFLLSRDSQYHFVNDAYFDESLLLQIYVGYIASFDNFYQYQSIDLYDHVEQYFKNFATHSEKKYAEDIQNELMTKQIFGSLKKGIEDGTVRPL